MEPIKYKPEFLEIVKDMSIVTNMILINKTDTHTYILRKDEAGDVNYKLMVPKEYFDFPNDQIAFYDYSEFYRFYKCLKSPEIYVDKDKIYMSDTSSKIVYKLSAPNALFKNLIGKDYKWPQTDCKFTLKKENIDRIMKMISNFSSDFVVLYGNENEFNIKVESTGIDNSFDERYEFENVSGFKDEFLFRIKSQVFNKIPPKKDYVVEIINKGFVRFSLIDENIDLKIITTYTVKK